MSLSKSRLFRGLGGPAPLSSSKFIRFDTLFQSTVRPRPVGDEGVVVVVLIGGGMAPFRPSTFLQSPGGLTGLLVFSQVWNPYLFAGQSSVAKANALFPWL